MKKQQIKNLEQSEISEISEKLFRVFLFPNLRFCPAAKMENSNLKISEKNFFKYTLQKNHGPFLGFICFSGPLCGYILIVCRLKSHSEGF